MGFLGFRVRLRLGGQGWLQFRCGERFLEFRDGRSLGVRRGCSLVMVKTFSKQDGRCLVIVRG